MGEIELRTVVEPRGPAAAIVLDDDQVAAIGEGARAFPVVATFATGSVRGRVGRRGDEWLLGMSRAAREEAGVAAGDEVDVRIALDGAPREIELPPALAAALDGDADARGRFDALAPGHRKEFARWVGEAKRDETRDKRVAQALEMIREGRTR